MEQPVEHDKQVGIIEDGDMEYTEQDNVIIFQDASMSSWHTDIDSNETLLKAARQKLQEEKRKKEAEERKKKETEKIVKIILAEGMNWPKTTWCYQEQHTTVQIIGDEFLMNWFLKDKRCRIIIHRFAHVNQWAMAIRNQQIRVQLPITVIALKCLKQYECLEPLKNAVAGLCRAIRSMGDGSTGRIFVAANIPDPWVAPVLGQRTTEHNKLLLRAVTGINIKLKRVFFCDMASHFLTSRRGKHIKPTSDYFETKGELTKTGCFVYHSCMF